MDGFEQAFWSGQSLDELYRSLASRPTHSMAALFVAAMREWKRSLEGQPRSFAGLQMRIEKVMDVTIQREIARLERHLLVLATVGSAGPFVGLFGTVWGIMTSFRAIAGQQTTSLAVVAPGIAEALFATAIGLVAAIPATIFYNKFVSDVNKQAQRLEGFADEFAAILSRQIDERGSKGIGDGDERRLCRGRRQAAAPPPPGHGRDQRDADGRRHAGPADHFHGVGPAADGRGAARPAADPGQEPRPGQGAAHGLGQREGQVYLQNTEIPVEELVAKLKAVTEARGGAEERIFVRGDQKVDYGTVMKVMGRISAAGFRRVALGDGDRAGVGALIA